MSEQHLAKGSVEPARVDGLLRLYSMRYCPYALIPRLVLIAKGIPHDIVNINLIRKPEWYLEIHPQGKVPALLDGSKVVIESADIAEYLDQKYPDKNPLGSPNPEHKKRDKELLSKVSEGLQVLLKSFENADEKTPEDLVKIYVGALQIFEDELANRKTTFFGGAKPGLLDYLLWPWAERAPLVEKKLNKKLSFDNQVPLLKKWRNAMLEDEPVKKTLSPIEKLWKVVSATMNKTEPPYDE